MLEGRIQEIPIREFLTLNDNIPFITSSDDKAREVERIMRWVSPDLPIRLTPVNLDYIEIQDIDVEAVSRFKANQVFELLGTPALVEDTGYSLVDAGGYPGALVKWVLKKLGNQGLINLANNLPTRKTVVTTVFSIPGPDGVLPFKGDVEGLTAEEERGEYGFGWDPVFIPNGQLKTYAEMVGEEKDRYSMRTAALRNFVEFIQGLRK